MGEKKKIWMWELFRYKMFVFALFCAFFNLILVVMFEPILSDRLEDLGVEDIDLGKYFLVQPVVYSITSLFVEHFFLKYMHKRICLILGFTIFGLGFLVIGPTRLTTSLFEPSVLQTCIGLCIIGVGNALSFVPIFAELIDSVKEHYEDRLGDLNNTVAGAMNCFYVSAALGHLSSGFLVSRFGFEETCEIFAAVAVLYAVTYLVMHRQALHE